MIMYATCRTAADACENSGISIDLGSMERVNEDTGETYTITDVACGTCGQPITELTESASNPPDPNPLEEQADG